MYGKGHQINSQVIYNGYYQEFEDLLLFRKQMTEVGL